MKKIIWLLVFILCLGLVSGENYYNKDSLDLNLRMGSDITIVPESSSYSLSKVEAKVYFFPEDGFQQEVLELETSPTVSDEGDHLLYKWIEPEELELKYWLEARVRVFDNIQKITGKVKFPLENLPSDVEKYIEAGEIIDSTDPEIREKASALIEGEDDLYVVVHKLATWVEENVEYDLSTITVEASQKASWVLENRRGVCDEMSSLFMAMARSLGIPVKFVSGVSYSNDPQFAEPWQAHGWAEVYFPGYGWVPFDATFDEYGYVDPTHIKLLESVDAGAATTRFSWLGNEVDIEARELDIDVGILKVGSEKAREVDLDIEILEEEIGFGSYNLVKVDVENLKNYYVAKTLYLFSTDEVDIVGGKKHILLKPGEKKTVYWVFKLSGGLESRYVYTFPVKVKTEKNYSVGEDFNSDKNAIVFSKNEIEERLAGMIEEEEKVLSKGVSVDCELSDEAIMLGGESSISCSVKNLGNVVLRGLEVCLDKCQQTGLNINEAKEFVGIVAGEEIGAQKFLVRVENEDVSKNVYVDYVVLDETEIIVGEVSFPEEVDYSDEFKISFVLEKKSFANPTDVQVVLLHEGYPNEWLIEELGEDKRFEVDFSGNDLGFGSNEFEILVSWEGGVTRENFVIELGETTFGEKIVVFFKSINRWLGALVK